MGFTKLRDKHERPPFLNFVRSLNDTEQSFIFKRKVFRLYGRIAPEVVIEFG
jgi:hypothetical protein